METPAVNPVQLTAGDATQNRTRKRLTKFLTTVCAGVLFLLLTAFSPQAAVEARTPLPRETKTVKITEKIPFGTDYVELPNTYRGYTEQVSDGVVGEKEVTFQILYEGGRPVKVISVQSTELARPVNEVVRRGAKVLKSQTVDNKPWEVSFMDPLKGKGWLSADFYDYRGHNGIDIAAPYGTPVHASAGGTVSMSGWYGEYGYCVIIDHADGSQMVYAHNSRLDVSAGQVVKQGQQIARIGTTGNSTGNHLHLELRLNGRFLDPLLYLNK